MTMGLPRQYSPLLFVRLSDCSTEIVRKLPAAMHLPTAGLFPGHRSAGSGGSCCGGLVLQVLEVVWKEGFSALFFSCASVLNLKGYDMAQATHSIISVECIYIYIYILTRA